MKLIKTTIYALALAVASGFTACQENEYGVVDLTPNPDNTRVEGVYTYNHPCAMFSQADFDRVKKSFDDGTAPEAVKKELENLKNSRYASKTYSPSPTVEIVRGDPKNSIEGRENYANVMRDAAAAYQQALLWKLTGDDDYAESAVNIMNAWADKCVRITAADQNFNLAAGAQGYTFANAAEILRSYQGWSGDDFNDFKKWLVDVSSTCNKDFLDRHAGTPNEHYWSNWDLVAMSSYLAIGILCENDEMVNYVVNYFYFGVGNGCIDNLVRGYHADPLGTGEIIGQNQESGRDQGHAQMSTAVAANLAQMAYTLYTFNPEIPKLDFFAAKDNALMQMGEYVALTNLRDGDDARNSNGVWLVSADKIPFSEFRYCMDGSHANQSHATIHTKFADDNNRGKLRSGWEIYYHHYAKVKNLTSGFKYAKMAADKMRPEGGAGEGDDAHNYGQNSGAFDQLGWGTLMLYSE